MVFQLKFKKKSFKCCVFGIIFILKNKAIANQMLSKWYLNISRFIIPLILTRSPTPLTQMQPHCRHSLLHHQKCKIEIQHSIRPAVQFAFSPLKMAFCTVLYISLCLHQFLKKHQNCFHHQPFIVFFSFFNHRLLYVSVYHSY